MVVSEMGEQWSPRVAPPRIVATAAQTTVLSSPPLTERARGAMMGTMIAIVPHEVPVRKEMMEQIRKEMTRRVVGVIQASVILTT